MARSTTRLVNSFNRPLMSSGFRPCFNHSSINSSLTGEDCFVFFIFVLPVSPENVYTDLSTPSFTTKHSAREIVLHCESQSMEHEPRCLLSDGDLSVNLPRRDAIAVVSNLPHDRHPFVQTNGGLFKNGSSLDRELGLRMPCFALPISARWNVGGILSATRRTFNAVRPAPLRQVIYAVINVCKVLDRFQKRLG